MVTLIFQLHFCFRLLPGTGNLYRFFVRIRAKFSCGFSQGIIYRPFVRILVKLSNDFLAIFIYIPSLEIFRRIRFLYLYLVTFLRLQYYFMESIRFLETICLT